MTRRYRGEYEIRGELEEEFRNARLPMKALELINELIDFKINDVRDQIEQRGIYDPDY